MSRGLIVVDDGGHSTGVITKYGQESFPSVKGLYGDRTLTKAKGRYDYIVEYLGEKYVMGTIAKLDCRLPLQMHTKTKQHLFYDLSVLVAIHQFGYLENNLIVSVPIKMHTDDEKNGRIHRLEGKHTVTVNDVTKTFEIVEVKVAPETAVSFWISEPEGKSRYLDLGSRTIGYATTVYEDGDVNFIDTESGTLFGKGIEALGDAYDSIGLADYICGHLLSVWKPDDAIQILGGGALDVALVERIREYFPNAEAIDNPQMANTLGMYMLGVVTYGTA